MERGGEEERRVLRGTPDRLSFKLRPGVRDRAYLLCLFEWVGSTGRPGLRPQLLTCFPSKVPWSLKDEQRERAREVPVKTRDGRMWEAIHSPLFCSFIPSSDTRFLSSVSLLKFHLSLWLSACLGAKAHRRAGSVSELSVVSFFWIMLSSILFCFELLSCTCLLSPPGHPLHGERRESLAPSLTSSQTASCVWREFGNVTQKSGGFASRLRDLEVSDSICLHWLTYMELKPTCVCVPAMNV